MKKLTFTGIAIIKDSVVEPFNKIKHSKKGFVAAYAVIQICLTIGAGWLKYTKQISMDTVYLSTVLVYLPPLFVLAAKIAFSGEKK